MTNISPELVFTALANAARLRCLMLLIEHGELCVCELTYLIGAAQPNMSRHLAQLRESGLVTDRREGRWIYYQINPELPGWVANILKEAYAGVSDLEPYKADRAILTKIPNRPEVPCCA